MNSFSTDYTPRTISDGIITPFVGGGENIPIYKEPNIPISMGGAGVADLVKKGFKKGLTKGSRIAKTQIVKAARKAKGKVTARARAVANKKLGAMKRKIKSQLKQKVTQIVTIKMGGKIPKSISSKSNKKVVLVMKNPPQNVKAKIRQNLITDVKKVIPRKTSIKGGLTHKQLVREAERAIYSGANF